MATIPTSRMTAMADPRSRRGRAIDPDRLGHLEEEKSFLLRSLDDLDRELAAGDVDRVDYDELHEGYVARAAAVMHQIKDAKAGLGELAAQRTGTGRRVAWVGAVVVFATVAGILLARASGFRGTGTSLTGTGAAPDEQLAQCEGQLAKDPKASLACFDKLLKAAPDDVETLTYGGWAKVQAGDVKAGLADLDRVIAIDPKYPNVYVFKASLHKTVGDFTAAQADLDRLYSLNPAAIVLDEVQSKGLDKAVAEGLLSPATGQCWTSAEAAMTDSINLNTPDASTVESDADKQKRAQTASKLTEAMQCLDKVVAAGPDITALEIRGLGLLALDFTIGSNPNGDDAILNRARQSADAAVTAAPSDPTAHLIRGTVAVVRGDTGFATRDLQIAKSGRVSPLFRAFLSLDGLSKAIDDGTAAGTTTTTTTTR